MLEQRRKAKGVQLTNLPLVTESPLANKVTSCPCLLNSSQRYETIRSVPPYSRGGTLSMRGAICAIFNFLISLGLSVRLSIDHLSSLGTCRLPMHRLAIVARFYRRCASAILRFRRAFCSLFQASKVKGFGGRMRIVEQLSVFGRFCAAICGEHVK